MEPNNTFDYTSRQLSNLERARFFPRQLVTSDDLMQDQIYAREKMRLRNQFSRKWGIVGGATVRQGSGDDEVIVDGGYILDPEGNEIFILQPTTLNLRQVCQQHSNQHLRIVSPEEMNELCCRFNSIQQPTGQTLYLTIHHSEYLTRPVPVKPLDDGCSHTTCEYTRIRDSYYFRLFNSLPLSYISRQQTSSGSIEDDGVVLAEITLPAKEGEIGIGYESCRYTIDRVQSGTATVSDSGDPVTVKFRERFSHPPKVVATPRQPARTGHPDTFAVTIKSVQEDTFSAVVFRVDKQEKWDADLYLDWIAYE